MPACIFIASVLLVHTALAQRSPYIMSLDVDDWTPDYVWMLDPNQQEVSNMTDKIPIYLHNAAIVTGPSYVANSIGAVQFLGDSSSHAVIPNVMNRLNSTFLFAWMMLVKPDSISQTGVLFEIYDGGVGIQMKQINGDVEVKALATDGSWHVINAKGVFAAPEWTFIAISFANFKMGRAGEQLLFFHGEDGGTGYTITKVSLKVTAGMVLEGTGNIRLGGSSDPAEGSFAGQVACVRYHHKLLVKTVDDFTVSCDPNDVVFADMLNSLSGNFINYVESTPAFVVTTEASTQGGTTSVDATTDNGITTQEATSAVPEVEVLDQKSADRCFHLQKSPGTANFSPATQILGNEQVQSLNACVGACASVSGCTSVAVETAVKDGTGAGWCILGGLGFATVADPGFYVYTVVAVVE